MHRLTMSPEQLDAEEMVEAAQRMGGTAIRDLADRQCATVTGAVRSIILRPSSEVPALVAELYDGTEPLTLVWLGRREIPGIHPGTVLKATGRVTRYRGVKTIFNASYQIIPAHD
jgi:DNA/RNA endonuclease YhcR with UshA esterase domain